MRRSAIMLAAFWLAFAFHTASPAAAEPKIALIQVRGMVCSS